MKIIYTIIFILFFNSINAQDRWVEQWIYMPVNGTPRLSEAWIQDSLNNIIEKRTIDFNGKSKDNWTSKTTSEYDSTNLIRVLSYSKRFKKGKQPSAEMIVNYNSDKQKVRLEIFDKSKKDNESLIIFTDYYYDINGNLIKEISTTTVDYMGNPSDTSLTTIHYKYESNRLVEEWKSTDTLNYEHFRYKYDSNGNMIEKRLLDKLDYLEKQIFEYKYDANGNMTKDKTLFNNGDLFRKHIYKYNDKGNMIELLEFASDSDQPDVKIIYKYSDIQ